MMTLEEIAETDAILLVDVPKRKELFYRLIFERNYVAILVETKPKSDIYSLIPFENYVQKIQENV